MTSSVIGFVVGVMFVIGYIPQVKELFKGSFKKDGGISGVSSVFWFFIFFGTYITYRNLVLTESHLSVIIPQGFNTYFALLIFIMVVTIKKDLSKSFVIVILSLIVVNVSFIILPTDLSQNFATAFISVAYITQIIKLIKNKDTSGLSIALFVFIAVSLLLMVVNIIISGSYIGRAS